MELLDLRTWNCWIFRGEHKSDREKPVPLRAMNRVNDKPNPQKKKKYDESSSL